jgi:Methyltransferase domain
MTGLTYLRRAAGVVVSDPAQALDRLRNRLERVGEPGDRHAHAADPAWEEHLHGLLGAPWPCTAAAEFGELWENLLRRMSVDELPLGEYHDADPAITRAVWCIATHLRPSVVVETGVARGVLASFVLQAQERAQHGALWSIDLPPLQESWHEQAGSAVSDDLRHRWTVLYGSSRRRLRPLLASVAPVDLFVHDSLHTERNMRFEFHAAWRDLRPGGVLVADDVDCNTALSEFADEVGARPLIGAQERKRGQLFGVVVKR